MEDDDPMSSLTATRLRELVEYSPETGEFIWKVSTGPRSQAGGRAGTYKKGHRSQIRVDGVIYKSHRLAWLYMTGEWPTDQVDHEDGDPSNNRWSNLRSASNTVNNRNKTLNYNNKTGISGVCIDPSKRRPTWCAYIKDGKKIHLGSFDNLLDAACARKSAELNLGYHQNHGRCRK